MVATTAETAPRYPRLPTWASWALTIAAAALVIASAFLDRTAGPPEIRFGPAQPFELAAHVVAAAALFLRHRLPLVTYGVVVGFAIAARFLEFEEEGFEVAYLVGVFAVAVSSSRRTTVTLALAAALGITAAEVLTNPSAWHDGSIWYVVLGVGFAAALGDAARMRKAYILAITERAERAEQSREAEARRRVAEDRLRIARDLHDAVAHQIAVVNLHAGAASQALPDRPDDAERSLATIREAARGVLGEISSLLQVLRTSGEAELERAAPGLAELPQLVDEVQRNGLRVARFDDGAPRELPPLTDAVAYRVVQEALTNAHKHGFDRTAELRLTHREDSLGIEVHNPLGDDRASSEPTTTRSSAAAPSAATPSTDGLSSGHGLVGMRERVESLGGHLSADASGGRFSLRVVLPARVSAEAQLRPEHAEAAG